MKKFFKVKLDEQQRVDGPWPLCHSIFNLTWTSTRWAKNRRRKNNKVNLLACQADLSFS